MFKVFGLNGDMKKKASDKWYEMNDRKEKESEEQYQARHDQHIKNLKPKPLKDCSTPESANEAVELYKKNGYTNLSIKFPKLFRTGKAKNPVRTSMVDISELKNVDAEEQSQLRAIA